MKKIIFFSKHMNIGGMEKSLVILLNSLTKYYDITLVLEQKKGLLLNDLNSLIKVKEYKLSTSKNIVFRKIVNYLKRTLWTLKNYHSYDFSCNYATYSIIGSKLALAASKNNAFYIHSDYYNVFNQNIEEFKRFFLPHKIDKFRNIIFVSNESKKNFLKVYPKFEEKCCVINNLIDYINIQKLGAKIAKSNIQINKNNKNFIFIGRLDNNSKNFDLMLDSFNISIKKDASINLFIVGTGPYENSIKKYIELNNLETNIKLISETKNPYTYLNQCDALILTSNFEGFPVVYMEALVLNKNILTTISTSDESINIKDYSTILKKNSEDISKKILEFKKTDRINNIDFNKINKIKIEKIKKLIEVN